MACFNPLLAEKRRQKRERLLAATEENLTKLARDVALRTKAPLSAAEIGVKAGRVVGRHKMAKHIRLTIHDCIFTWSHDEESIRQEGLLDGIYVVRTSEPAERLSSEASVRAYKRLSVVEQLFGCLKGIDLLVRPIHHRLELWISAHVLICVLEYYVEWHLRRAWRSLLFEDEELDRDRLERDPVARRSRRPRCGGRCCDPLGTNGPRVARAAVGLGAAEIVDASDRDGVAGAQFSDLAGAFGWSQA